MLTDTSRNEMERGNVKVFVSERCVLEDGVVPAMIVVRDGRIEKILRGCGDELRKRVVKVSGMFPIIS